MAPAPTRESLESMKRADLQKLCKVRNHLSPIKRLGIHPETPIGLRRQGEPQNRSSHRLGFGRDDVRVSPSLACIVDLEHSTTAKLCRKPNRLPNNSALPRTGPHQLGSRLPDPRTSVNLDYAPEAP